MHTQSRPGSCARQTVEKPAQLTERCESPPIAMTQNPPFGVILHDPDTRRSFSLRCRLGHFRGLAIPDARPFSRGAAPNTDET
jgi:hypothetical protein